MSKKYRIYIRITESEGNSWSPRDTEILSASGEYELAEVEAVVASAKTQSELTRKLVVAALGQMESKKP